MQHARDLWNNWHGDLSRQFVKPARNMQHAIKNCPKGIPKSDWEWLVNEHFYIKDFIVSVNLVANMSTSPVIVFSKVVS